MQGVGAAAGISSTLGEPPRRCSRLFLDLLIGDSFAMLASSKDRNSSSAQQPLTVGFSVPFRDAQEAGPRGRPEGNDLSQLGCHFRPS